MTTSELRDYLNQQLAQLSPHFLQVVVEFVEFLLQKQGDSRQGDSRQGDSSPTLHSMAQKQDASTLNLAQAIEQRFAPLGDFEIPVIPREPIRSIIDFQSEE